MAYPGMAPPQNNIPRILERITLHMISSLNLGRSTSANPVQPFSIKRIGGNSNEGSSDSQIW
jgi:hypothetical protein